MYLHTVLKTFKNLYLRKSFYGVKNFALKARLFFFHLKDNPLYMSIQVYTFIRFLLHAVLSYKERFYKERLVEHENHKEWTLVKLGRVKEHSQLSKYAL